MCTCWDKKGKRENGMGIGLQAWHLVGQNCDNDSTTVSEQASDNHMMQNVSVPSLDVTLTEWSVWAEVEQQI